MRSSLRWRLQGWYALVLLMVVGGFAGLLYAQARSSRYQEIDAALTADALHLDTNLRRFPLFLLGTNPPDEPRMPFRPGDWPPDRGRPDRRGGPPMDKGGPRPEGPPNDRRVPDDRRGPDRPPDNPRPPDRRGPPPSGGPIRPSREQLLADLTIPNRPVGDGESRGATYFVIWRADGSVLKATELPADTTPPVLPTESAPAMVRLHWRGEYREATVLAPESSKVLVGRSVAKEQAELSRFAWRLVGAGLAVLAVGLAGGWLASTRILRPIAAISATASSISETNLSERIDSSTVDVELVGLADMLNETFDRLEKAFDRQARFTADASHELRTPLAVLRSQAQLALSRPRTPDEYRRAIEECLRAAERMTALVDGLLTLARCDAGKLDMLRQPVDLRQVTSDALKQLRPLAEGQGIAIAAHLSPAQVDGDPDRLGQLVANLVTNAVRYNRPGGNVRVRLDRSNGEAVLSIEDTGCGIAETDRPHIFERFYRVDKARSRASGGTGLGLAICKSIVQAHGGEITFDSAPDQGTTFRVRLPATSTMS